MHLCLHSGWGTQEDSVASGTHVPPSWQCSWPTLSALKRSRQGTPDSSEDTSTTYSGQHTALSKDVHTSVRTLTYSFLAMKNTRHLSQVSHLQLMIGGHFPSWGDTVHHRGRYTLQEPVASAVHHSIIHYTKHRRRLFC